MKHPVKTIRFKKSENGTALTCEVQLLDDGSVYVCGDVEIIFEDSADALQEATDHLIGQGFRACD